MRATRAIIHLENLKHNIQTVRSRVGSGCKICIPVKADAYGHGAIHTAVAAIRAGAEYLAVASVQEGAELRQAGIVAPILLLSLPVPEELPEIIEHAITPLVSDTEFAALLETAAKEAGSSCPVHLKIDTGMGRIGCAPEEAAELASMIDHSPWLTLEGSSTHYACADSCTPEDIAFTQMQTERFKQAIASIRAANINPGIVHAANSGAIVQHPDTFFDMVRPGLLLYGYQPIQGNASLEVLPLMELDTHIVFIKKLHKGESVSYGRIWTADRDTTIATLPLGYADGLLRRLSGKLKVRIGKDYYPLVGRICMDQCLVDIGPESSIQRWEKAIVFGPESGDNSARDLAEQLQTIPYEITCGINKRVPRVYISGKT